MDTEVEFCAYSPRHLCLSNLFKFVDKVTSVQTLMRIYKEVVLLFIHYLFPLKIINTHSMSDRNSDSDSWFELDLAMLDSDDEFALLQTTTHDEKEKASLAHDVDSEWTAVDPTGRVPEPSSLVSIVAGGDQSHPCKTTSVAAESVAPLAKAVGKHDDSEQFYNRKLPDPEHDRALTLPA